MMIAGGAWRLCAAASIAVLAVTHLYAAAMRKPAARPAVKPRASRPAAPKPDPIGRLSRALILNSIATDDANLADACELASAKTLLWALDGVVADWNYAKGEFETTADYDARIAKMEQVVNQDRKTIVCKALSEETAFIKYDADKQEFSVDAYPLKNNAVDERDTGSYLSATRMGVKARVYRGIRVDYDVDLGGSSYDIGKTVGCAAPMLGALRFPVASAAAKLARIGGYVMMIGRLRQPFYAKDERSGKPTLDDPFDTYTVTLSLKFTPESVYIVSPTGERFGCVR